MNNLYFKTAYAAIKIARMMAMQHTGSAQQAIERITDQERT